MVNVSDVVASLNDLESGEEQADLANIKSSISALDSSVAAVKEAYNSAVPYIKNGARVHEIFYALANNAGAKSAVAKGFQKVGIALTGTAIETEISLDAIN